MQMTKSLNVTCGWTRKWDEGELRCLRPGSGCLPASLGLLFQQFHGVLFHSTDHVLGGALAAEIGGSYAVHGDRLDDGFTERGGVRVEG